jgi:hypothetical protein
MVTSFLIDGTLLLQYIKCNADEEYNICKEKKHLNPRPGLSSNDIGELQSMIQDIRYQRKYNASNHAMLDSPVNGVNHDVNLHVNQEHASSDQSWGETVSQVPDDLVEGNTGNRVQISHIDPLNYTQFPLVDELLINSGSNNTGNTEEVDHVIVNNHLDNNSLSSGFADSSEEESDRLNSAIRIENNIISQETQLIVVTNARDIDSVVHLLQEEGESNYNGQAVGRNMSHLVDQIPNGMSLGNENNVHDDQVGNQSDSSGFADSSLEEVDGFVEITQDRVMLLMNAGDPIDNFHNYQDELEVNHTDNLNESEFMDNSHSGMSV